ncbi:hypothetical protein H0H87_000330 [Tephrocybe sp. NHM501043]|nr:hypothetical protein H0H87_000330 [Tephrocybe sp. NHM501043]
MILFRLIYHKGRNTRFESHGNTTQATQASLEKLSYGENNWKAHMIMTQNYSSWYSKHVTHNTKAKLEKEELKMILTQDPESTKK